MGALFGIYSLNLYKLKYSLYNRKGLDDLTNKYMGYSTWDKLLIKSLFTPSFDYNSKTPRFYGNYFRREDPARFNGTLSEAV